MSLRSGFPPRGVEKVTWDDVSPEDRDSLEQAWRERDLRLCQACGLSQRETHLLTCAACGNNRIHRIFYCSQDCQKLDWKNHKTICGRDFEGPDGFGVPRGKSHHTELNREREIWTWLEAMRYAAAWGTVQALGSSPRDNNDIPCINFRFETDPSKTLDGSFYLVRMHYSALTDEMRKKLVCFKGNDRILGWYTVSLDRRLRINGMVTTHSPAINVENVVLLRQWPWILSQVAFFKTYDPRIVAFLTETLARVVTKYHQTPRDIGIFDRFIVPPFTEDWMVEKFWEWELLMRNVISFDPNGPPKGADDDPNTEIS